MDPLKKLVEPLRSELESLRQQEDKARAELDQVVELRKRVEKTLNFLTTGSATPQAAAAKAKSKRSTKPTPSQVQLDRVYDALPSDGDRTVTELVKNGLAMHPSTVRAALEALRDQERVRKTGERRAEGATSGMKATAWAKLS